MASVHYTQSSFTSGEIDPRMYARVTLRQYQNGLKKLRDCLVIPQGPVRRRFGIEFKLDITSLVTNSDPTTVRLTGLQDGNTNAIMLFSDTQLNIYTDDSSGFTAVGTLTSLSYTSTDIQNLNFTQDENRLIIVHPDYIPKYIQATTFPTTWPTTLTDFSFKFQPTYDFARDYDSLTFTASATTGVGITITSSSNFFEARHQGGMIAFNGGTARITTSTDPASTTCTADVVDDFDDTKAESGSLSFVGEPIYSSSRGYPAVVGFYQNRLGFANTKDLPSGVWFSVFNDLDNFNEAIQDDSGAISDYMRTGNQQSANIVRSISGVRSLIIFTSDSEFSTPLLENSGFTPSSSFIPQSTEGSSSNIDAQILDNQIFFVDRTGKSVHSLVYDIQSGSFKARDVSINASHMINSPIRMATFKNSTIDEGKFLILINQDDGTEFGGGAPIFQTNLDQEVQAWSFCKPAKGIFTDVATIGNDVYFINQVIINGNVKFYLCKLNFNCYTDYCKNYTITTHTTSITGLTYLEGETVNIRKSDGTIYTPQQVVGGKINMPVELSNTNIEIGIAFTPEVVPLPLSIQTGNGNTRYKPTLIRKITIDYYQSARIRVNGYLLQDINLPVTLNTSFPLTSGILTIPPETGYTRQESDTENIISITQTDPIDFMIRAIDYTVDIT